MYDWRQAVTLFICLIVGVVLVGLMAAVVWWVWRYLMTELPAPYRDPDPPPFSSLPFGG